MSSPYYTFGGQRRYPYQWHGGAGGVPQGRRGAPRSLGNVLLEESGLTPYSLPFPALAAEGDTDEPPYVIAPGDWPALRPSGPEPLNPPLAGIPFWDGLSDNEKNLVLLLGAAGAAWWFLKKKKPSRRRRRNPHRRVYMVPPGVPMPRTPQKAPRRKKKK